MTSGVSIIESVDSISRDGLDMPMQIIQNKKPNTQSKYIFKLCQNWHFLLSDKIVLSVTEHRLSHLP